MATGMEFVRKEVKLSDGRTAIVRELSGLDEYKIETIVAGGYAGVTKLNPVELSFKMANVSAMASIESIGGQECGPLHSLADVTKLQASLKKRDLDRILKAYKALNEDEDSPESDAAEQN